MRAAVAGDGQPPTLSFPTENKHVPEKAETCWKDITFDKSMTALWMTGRRNVIHPHSAYINDHSGSSEMLAAQNDVLLKGTV